MRFSDKRSIELLLPEVRKNRTIVLVKHESLIGSSFRGLPLRIRVPPAGPSVSGRALPQRPTRTGNRPGLIVRSRARRHRAGFAAAAHLQRGMARPPHRPYPHPAGPAMPIASRAGPHTVNAYPPRPGQDSAPRFPPSRVQEQHHSRAPRSRLSKRCGAGGWGRRVIHSVTRP
jgi:hypothetical protein